MAGEDVAVPGVTSVEGPKPSESEVAVRATVAEAVPTVSVPEDLVTATPAAGVLPTFEAKSEGLDDRFPHQEEGD
jgi:hypothetical protein